MMTDQRRVIIANFVFRYATKAPYVESGHSLLGAIEVDRAGRMKCHECGSFEHCLAEHLASHEMRCRDYRLKHGLTHYAKLRLNKNRKRAAPVLGRIDGSLGSEMYEGDLRYCYRCLDWADPNTKCPGSKVACCGNGRS